MRSRPPLRSVARSAGLRYKSRMRVTEIFFSIQGEGSRAGRPCVFVRFTGCDLRCGYCDTAYAFQGGVEMSRGEILAEVARHPSHFVLLTGGEPLLQKELPELVEELIGRRYEVAVETHGQRPLDALPPAAIRIVDVKTPGSGEPATDFRYLDGLMPHDEVKFVVCSEADFRWSEDVVRRHRLERRLEILFSPAWGQVDPKELARWLLASGLDARLSLQIHKVVWGAETRGV